MRSLTATPGCRGCSTKARATLAGTAGRYQFGCPVDHTCLVLLGVAPEVMLDLVARCVNDRAVLDKLRAYGIPPAADAWFDGEAVEHEPQQTGNYLRVRERDALPDGESGRIFPALSTEPASASC